MLDYIDEVKKKETLILFSIIIYKISFELNPRKRTEQIKAKSVVRILFKEKHVQLISNNYNGIKTSYQGNIVYNCCICLEMIRKNFNCVQKLKEKEFFLWFYYIDDMNNEIYWHRKY